MFPELALIHFYSCAQTKCDMIRDVLNYICTAAATDAIFALVKMALDLCKWRQSERERGRAFALMAIDLARVSRIALLIVGQSDRFANEIDIWIRIWIRESCNHFGLSNFSII